MNKKLIIIGAGGHGKVVADIANKMNNWDTILFLDDNQDFKEVLDFPVVGKFYDANKYVSDSDFIVGIGNNLTRERIYNSLEAIEANITILTHPSVIIGAQVSIGKGTVIAAGVIINCCTTIGRGCIINTASSIDHDNVIDDFAHISPGVHAAGNVKIGKNCWLGVGSIIKNNTYITNNCIIGAGAVVVNDIYESGTYMGIPARLVSTDK